MLRFALVLMLLCLQSAWAAPKPEAMTFCYEDDENHPWIMKDRPSYISIMVEMMAQRLGVKIQMVGKPWKRCLLEMQLNALDGVVNASYVAERAGMGVYPASNGKPDPSKRMLKTGYSLYRLRGNPVKWDGVKITNLHGVVGAQTSFSIVAQLRKAGVPVDDSSKKGSDLLRRVLLGNFAAAALPTENGDQLVAADPSFQAQIEKLPMPLVEKPYYLMLSKKFVAVFPDFSAEVWNAVAAVRESQEFAQRVAPLFGTN